MSMEMHAFLEKSNVPQVNQWQAVINQLGFSLTLRTELRAFEDSGFVPCTLNGSLSGFEIYYEPASVLLASRPQLKKMLAGRDYAVSFRWGSEMAELVCVCIASAVLAKSFGAQVYDPDSDQILSAEELLKIANEAMTSLK